MQQIRMVQNSESSQDAELIEVQDKAEEKPVLLFLDVNLGQGKSSMLKLHKGEDVSTVINAFCQ